MLFNISIFLLGLFFIFKRFVLARKPIYILKINLYNDRVIELLIILLSFVIAVTDNINYYLVHKRLSTTNILIYIAILVILSVLTFLEYNKNKVGVYENGILMKSQIYPWRKIYTYRIKKMEGNRTKILFYIHDYFDKDKLNISSILVSDIDGENIVKAIGENLDQSRS